MPYKTIEQNGLTWYHFDRVNEDDLKFLRKNFAFHPLTLKDIRSEQENPKIDNFDDYFFGVFQFGELKKQPKKLRTHEVDFYVGKDYVVTIQESKFRIHRDLFFKVAKNKKMRNEFFEGSVNFLFYKIAYTLFTYSCEPIIEQLAKDIKKLEEAIYESEELREALIETSVVRRIILNFKRIIEPQIKLVHNLAHSEKGITIEHSHYYDDIDDYVERVWIIINNQLEIVGGLNMTSESLISFKTNEIIKILTIFSVALLPLTLFSGLYGMNIRLPFQQQPAMVWLLFIILVGIVSSVSIYLIRRNR